MAALLIRECERLSLTKFDNCINGDISSLSQGVSRLLKRSECNKALTEKMKLVQSRPIMPVSQA